MEVDKRQQKPKGIVETNTFKQPDLIEATKEPSEDRFPGKRK